MPRVIHKPVVGVVQRVISRFVNGYHLMNSDEIRGQYLARLGTVLAESDWRLLWYALMTDHGDAYPSSPYCRRVAANQLVTTIAYGLRCLVELISSKARNTKPRTRFCSAT
jgi:hypothetical protein